jgi:hypothetical protein
MVRESAEYNMNRYESCSQSILAAFMGEFGVEDPLVMASEDYGKCRTRVADGAEEIGHFLVELNGRGELFRSDLKQALG